MCQNGLKILLRAIVRHGPQTGDLPSVWLDTCGSLPYQPDALARVAASPSQGFAGSKASRGQALFRSKEGRQTTTNGLRGAVQGGRPSFRSSRLGVKVAGSEVIRTSRVFVVRGCAGSCRCPLSESVPKALCCGPSPWSLVPKPIPVLRPGQPTEHQLNHADPDLRLAGISQVFIILAVNPAPTQPAEGSLHHPPPRQQLKH